MSEFEVRAGYYGGLVVTSEMLRIQREDIEMRQHYEDRRQAMDDEIMALQLRSKLIARRMGAWSYVQLVCFALSLMVIFHSLRAHAQEPKITCKEYFIKDDCNTCTCTKCTDGKTQWDDGGCTCTAVYCVHKEPIDKNFWSARSEEEKKK